MGFHPCWHLSQPQSPWPCCGSSVRPLQAVSTFPQLTPIPWRVKQVITAFGALTQYAAIPVPFLPTSVCHGISARLLTHRVPFGKPATSPHFARSLNRKGFPLFPISPQPLQSRCALCSRSAENLTLAFEASSHCDTTSSLN